MYHMHILYFGIQVSDYSHLNILETNFSNHDDDFRLYGRFYSAVWNGDWKLISEFLTTKPNAIRARIRSSGRTALHIAAIAWHAHIVEKLVDEMSESDLEMKDSTGSTALALAAAYGANISIAQCMVDRNDRIVSVRVADRFPAVLAFRYGHKGMGRYLYSVTPLEELVLPRNGVDGATLICDVIYMKRFDLLSQCPELAITVHRFGTPPLYALVNLPSAFPSGSRPLGFWQQWVCDCICINQDLTIKEICKKLQNLHSQTNAISSADIAYIINIVKYIYEMKLIHVQTFELLRRMCEVTINLDGNQMEHCLVYGSLFRAADRGQLGVTAGLDKDGNNMLHMAGMLSPYPQLNQISGAALQMQRELQWFKVESIVPSWALEHTNSKYMTPAQQFTKDHKELVIEGEKWMKEMATSCIVTIMFAAAFTVPGGAHQDTGFPMFLHKKMFMVFVLSDSISVFSSTTSVLKILGILTTRYAEEDHLKSLPKKMIIGLSTPLFLSIATMMIAIPSSS
ncbi:hypothetical protein FNV43_RR25449 [Rhamnella rubrinervis]|uniref:PGG domain-containing protein n=1 Tax=Rhamnella rubrinervis TaxID=2594499 RepID=A0A8K0DPP0_9ROSA|nr:hypothetical protein FNV43_RR25449 [Rhamnella rubrinervis]